MAGSWTWVAECGDLRIGVTTSRREHTTSTVIISGKTALMVDPCWDPDELEWFGEDLRAAGVTTIEGFATHAHHDHVLWHPTLGPGPRWASARTARAAQASRDELIDALGSNWPKNLADLAGRVRSADRPAHRDHDRLDSANGNIKRLPWDGPEVTMVTHDAHSAGHTALWVPMARALIAGDMLSDLELPLIEDSTPSAYDGGLTALWPFVERAQVLIPGHGNPAFGGAAIASRWAADRRYLDSLLAGKDPADPRQNAPGMSEAHRQNRSRVTGDPDSE